MNEKILQQLAIVKARLETYPYGNHAQKFLGDALIIIIRSMAGETVSPRTMLGDTTLQQAMPDNEDDEEQTLHIEKRPGMRAEVIAPGVVQYVPENPPPPADTKKPSTDNGVQQLTSINDVSDEFLAKFGLSR